MDSYLIGGLMALVVGTYLIVVIGMFMRRKTAMIWWRNPGVIVLQQGFAVCVALAILISLLFEDELVACHVMSFVYILLMPAWAMPTIWANFAIAMEARRNYRKALRFQSYKASSPQSRRRTLEGLLDASSRNSSGSVESVATSASSNSTSDEQQPFLAEPLPSRRHLVGQDASDDWVASSPSSSSSSPPSAPSWMESRFFVSVPFVLLVIFLVSLPHIGIYFAIYYLRTVHRMDEFSSLETCLHDYRIAFFAMCAVYLVAIIYSHYLLKSIRDPALLIPLSRAFVVLGSLGIVPLFILVVDPTLFAPRSDWKIVLSFLLYGLYFVGILPILLSFDRFRERVSVLFECFQSHSSYSSSAKSRLHHQQQLQLQLQPVEDVETGHTHALTKSPWSSVRVANKRRVHSVALDTGGIASLSNGDLFVRILQEQILLDSFTDYLKDHWCIETISFYQDVRVFRTRDPALHPQLLIDDAIYMINEYITNSAHMQINITDVARKPILQRLTDPSLINPFMFEMAFKEVGSCIADEHVRYWRETVEFYEAVAKLNRQQQEQRRASTGFHLKR